MNIQEHYRRKQARDESDRFIADIFARGTEEANKPLERWSTLLAYVAMLGFIAWVAHKSGAF